ncbi:LuxR family transcriptional regulator [Asanoa ishikariensis]|uniref:Regulatory protein, luxR family n=1 Tax=Asanoa ishikariensis TaxID=137265 RepID=A0A1H3U830_9ACTN|nr:LuxR family transcriptional regulator [Asanoa ishikariensis]GIF64106.1 LuxR family transcriptional regulator [Asanoa ishikariensis]SDZ58592.1 regulatory protein, luxR family [Asanoa ishikariensis]
MELFGREVELARISRFLESVRGGGDVRMVRGEPGVGKSALLTAAAELAVDDGMRVLRASGSEFEADISYSVLNQLLLPVHTEIPRQPPGMRDALNVALGFGPGPPPPVLLVCNAALSLLSTIARKTPVLLLVDDVQWVDRPSAVVLGFIARRVQGTSIGVVASSRIGTEGLLDRRGLTEVVVQPLSPEAATRFVDARYPDLLPQVRQRLLDLAEGNPLALVELPATLTEVDPPAPLTETGGVGPDVVPLNNRLRAVFAARVGGLPEATRRLLLLATFEGSGELRVLRGITSLTDLAPAERAQLVRVDGATGRIAFRHPLIKSAIVAMSTHTERRDAHLDIAAALPRDWERRAWHLAAAAADPDESIAAMLDESARRVMQRGDVLGAVSALVRAAELSASGENRARRLAEAAYLGAEAGGARDDLRTLLAEAQITNPDPSGALNAASAAALLMINGDGDVHTAHRLLAGAIETGRHGWRADDPALDEAMHTLLLLSWYAGTPEHWAVFNRALDRLTPGPSDILAVMSKTFPDPVRTGAAARTDLDALLATLADEDDLTRAMRIGTAAVYVDRLAEIRESAWRLVQQGRDGGAPRRQLGALMHLGLDGYLTGRWDEAEELAKEGQKLCAEAGLPFLTWYFLFNRANIAAGRGLTDEAYALADEITRWALPRGVAGATAIAHYPRTIAAAAEGDFQSAYLHATAISPVGVLAPYVPVAMWAVLDLVEAALRTGRTTEARAHADAVRRANLAGISPRMALIQRGVDALVLDDDEAGRHLEEMLSSSAAQRWRFEACRIRLAFAEKLRRGKSFARAREHLLEARTGFAAIGAEPWLTRSAQELRATGYRPAIAEEPGPVTLTTQELEIARLAASGLSNKQIGERLFLSHRTVGAHLYRIFPKLGISSRAGLRDALSTDHPSPQAND